MFRGRLLRGDVWGHGGLFLDRGWDVEPGLARLEKRWGDGLMIIMIDDDDADDDNGYDDYES